MRQKSLKKPKQGKRSPKNQKKQLQIDLAPDRHRQFELEQIEKLLSCWYPVATSYCLEPLKKNENVKDDHEAEAFNIASKAAALVLKIMERRAELLGLDDVEIQPSSSSKETPLEQLAKIVKIPKPFLYQNHDSKSGSSQN